ncbi:hypothetical protein [Polaromonas sp. 35-63-35]|uniref:hypothetical protein n=1 Tax=Polaromonas sp. 35-63-35 TaxID=1970418 RepID=UPI000BCFF4D3|nr:hypothetical protein [Polaromonas sp. 35-63-35]OYY37067.1 MAG: hypothetical protein B7Y60_08835 [Polaromonas sp. 35-63-35]
MKTEVQTQDITVRSTGGTYQTNIVRGFNASCTAGEKQAAERLGEKLYGASLVTVEPLPRGSDHNITHWRLHAEPVHAWAWQSGLIEFGREVPEGALSFATGMDRPLRARVSALAREGMGKSAGKLLVPGVPEAENETANGKETSCGVVFSNRQGSAA